MKYLVNHYFINLTCWCNFFLISKNVGILFDVNLKSTDILSLITVSYLNVVNEIRVLKNCTSKHLNIFKGYWKDPIFKNKILIIILIVLNTAKRTEAKTRASSTCKNNWIHNFEFIYVYLKNKRNKKL